MSPYARRLYLTDFLPKNLIEMAPFLGVRKLIIWLFECQADFDASYGYFARVSAQTSEQSLEQSTKQALIGLRTGQVMLWIRYFNQREWDELEHKILAEDFWDELEHKLLQNYSEAHKVTETDSD